MKVLLRECQNHDVIYDIVSLKKDVTIEQVQQAIYDVKNRFDNEGRDDWTVEDILSELDDNLLEKSTEEDFCHEDYLEI